MKKIENLRLIGLILFINTVVYSIIILNFPNYANDDFLIFSLISGKPSNPISTNIHEFYYLFMRPITYFSFWLDYTIWGQNAVAMKFTTLIFHLAFITSFYFLLAELCTLVGIKLNKWIILVLTTLVSFHPDNIKWIIYINNRTELLVVLFYTLGLLTLIKYIGSKNGKVTLAIGALCFFIFSTLSKEQSMHFPLLPIFAIILMKNKISSDKKQNLLIISIVGMAFVIVLLLIHAKLYSAQTNLVYANIWKKPFSMLGTLLCVINPYSGELIYQFFLNNRSLALISLLVFVVTITYYFVKTRPNLKTVVVFASFCVAIFIPRIFAAGGSRLNSIQIIWFFIFLIICYKYAKYQKTMKVFLFILLFATSANIMINIKDESRYQQLCETEIKSLVKLYDKYTFIAVSRDPNNLPYYYFFEKYNKFGKEDLNISPFYYHVIAQYYWGKQLEKINCYKNFDTIVISPSYNQVNLAYILDEGWLAKYKNLEHKRKAGRDYQLIKYMLPSKYHDYKIIYYNGQLWQQI